MDYSDIDVVHNGRPMSDEEIAVQKEWAKQQKDLEAIEKVKADVKQSALDKLKKLGLTVDEAKAVIGIE